MRTSLVRQRWSQGKPAFCTQVNLTDPSVCELVSLLGFDCIWLDLEHHTTELNMMVQMARAARVGRADVLARPAKGELMRMGRMLEGGANGILYPRCENANEAADVVRWAKFAPLGERGFDGGNCDNAYGMIDAAQYVQDANEQTFIAIQIESPPALERVSEIAAVEGIDLVFFGPGDYSVLCGLAGQSEHPKVLRAAEKTCKAALAANKRFGSTCASSSQARRLLDMGATLIAYGSDLTLLKKAYFGIRQEFGPLGFAFGESPTDRTWEDRPSTSRDVSARRITQQIRYLRRELGTMRKEERKGTKSQGGTS